MQERVVFGCDRKKDFSYPPELIAQAGVRFPQVHQNASEMAKFARLLMKAAGGGWCVLPLCTTVEAETLGAAICLGDAIAGPRAQRCTVRSLDDLEALPAFDLNSGRIAAVLAAAGMLAEQELPVMLNVEGAFTILDYLMESGLLFRALLARDLRLTLFLDRLRDDLLCYLKAGAEQGVRLFSFADPSGNRDMVGSRIFERMTVLFTAPFLRLVLAQTDGLTLHLCPKLYNALKDLDAVHLQTLKPQANETYGNALARIADQSRATVLLGQRCVNR